MLIDLKYGCPRCSGEIVETGEYIEHKIWVDDEESTFHRILRRLRRLPKPKHREVRREPRTKEVYREQRISIELSNVESGITGFTCTNCNTHFDTVKMYKNDSTTWISWQTTFSRYPAARDIDVRTFSTHDCDECGGRLTKYKDGGTIASHSLCRNCGEKHSVYYD